MHRRDFFIPIYASRSGRDDLGQENVNILQHLQSDRQLGARSKMFLNLLVQFCLNNIANVYQLTSDILITIIEINNWNT